MPPAIQEPDWPICLLHPVALVRESSNPDGLPDETELRQGDLTDIQGDVCGGCDAAVFAAGSGGNICAEMTEKIDRDSAKSFVDIAAQAKVGRLVMLSTVGADNPDSDSNLGHYLQAKHEADEHLKLKTGSPTISASNGSGAA